MNWDFFIIVFIVKCKDCGKSKSSKYKSRPKLKWH